MRKIILLGMVFCLTTLRSQNLAFQWAKKFGASNFEYSHSVATDPLGNVYTAGLFRGTVDFDPGTAVFNLTSTSSTDDIFISKLDANGNFVWAKKIGGASPDRATSLAVDASGNVHLTGYFQGTVDFDPNTSVINFTSVGNRDVFVCKLTSAGNYVWTKTFGGSIADEGTSIALDASGNVYTSGIFQLTADFDVSAATYTQTSVGSNDCFIEKLDANGNFVYAKTYGGTGFDFVYSIKTNASGDVFTTGNFVGTVDFDPSSSSNFTVTPASPGGDAYILKLSGSGNFVWVKTFQGSSFPGTSCTGNSIAFDGAGNIYTTGSFSDNIDFDPSAGVYILGTTSGSHCFISKLDASGNFVWAVNTDGSNQEIGNSIAVDNGGDVFVGGDFSGTADLDPSAGTYSLTSLGSPGYKDSFILRLSSNGNFILVKQFGGTDEENLLSIFVDAASNVYATGYFSLTVDFDPDAPVFNMTSGGWYDAFIFKLSNVITASINEIQDQEQMNVYPSPNNGEFTLMVPETGTYTIINSIGQTVESIEVKEDSQIINVNGLADGIYYIIGKTAKAKIIVSKL